MKGSTMNEKLSQSSEKYNWDKFRPSCFCAPFRFAFQLTLLGCCGSFLFGFNVGLLNQAVNVIAAEYQLCGEPSAYANYIYTIARERSLAGAVSVNRFSPFGSGGTMCQVTYDESDVPIDIVCGKGGYADLSCDQFKWYAALLRSAVMITGTVGSAFAGSYLKFGRRSLFLMTMITFFVGVISSLTANSFAALFWARLIVGFGVGMVSVASPTYISEMVPRQERGKFGVFHQLAITIGIFLAILIAIPLVDPASQPSYWKPDLFTRFWWRFMIGLGLLPLIVAVYLLALVYSFETPVYYVEQGRYRDAYRLYEKFLDKSDLDQEFESCVQSVKIGEEYKKQSLSFWSALTSERFGHVIIVGLLLAAFQQIGGINVFMTSSSAIFEKAGLTAQMQLAMSIIMAGINVLMTFPTILLIDRIGRRTILLYASALQFLCVVPCAIAYWIEKDAENPSPTTKGLAVFAVIGFVVFFAVGFGPVVWVYIFEIFPMEIKDSGSSIGTSVNWLAAIIIVFLANVLPNKISFSIFSFLQFLATVFILFCVRETKGLPLGTSPYIKMENKSQPIPSIA